MKGIIVYSSNTGNTKRMAETLYREFSREYKMELQSIKEVDTIESYDFALMGSWIQKGFPDPKIIKLLEETSVEKVGLFVTLGSNPASEFGKKTEGRLRDKLKDKKSLGQILRHGKVSDRLAQAIPGLSSRILTDDMKQQMYEASIISREATEEELQEAADYFLENLKRI